MFCKNCDFYPRPPGGGRHFAAVAVVLHRVFLSTPSGWRATADDCKRRANAKNFYPRPPGGGRHFALQAAPDRRGFLSTPSGWRATRAAKSPPLSARFLSTPSGWRATALFEQRKVFVLRFLSTPSGWRATPWRRYRRDDYRISIHALRVEGDSTVFCALLDMPISIHALRVEGDNFISSTIMPVAKFLSTPSGWRATSGVGCVSKSLEFLSTPSGWRATLCCHICRSLFTAISIHALRVEGD